MYGSQIDAAQALVTGLQKQQTKLNSIMEKAADAMAKKLKAAMSKKATGGVIGAAASGGIRSGMTLVGERGPELAELAAGSRVRTAGDTARILAGAAAGNGAARRSRSTSSSTAGWSPGNSSTRSANWCDNSAGPFKTCMGGGRDVPPDAAVHVR